MIPTKGTVLIDQDGSVFFHGFVVVGEEKPQVALLLYARSCIEKEISELGLWAPQTGTLLRSPAPKTTVHYNGSERFRSPTSDELELERMVNKLAKQEHDITDLKTLVNEQSKIIEEFKAIEKYRFDSSLGGKC